MLGMIGSNNTASVTLAKNASIQFIGSNNPGRPPTTKSL
jgi:hypothetical protein